MVSGVVIAMVLRGRTSLRWGGSITLLCGVTLLLICLMKFSGVGNYRTPLGRFVNEVGPDTNEQWVRFVAGGIVFVVMGAGMLIQSALGS